MKVIFIDIDGVFLPARAHFLPGQDMASPRLMEKGEGDASWPENWEGRRWAPIQRKLDPVAVSLLSRLVELSDAKVVAISSWKDHPAAGKQAIEEAFLEAGWDISKAWHADWRAPSTMKSDRARELSLWMEDNPAFTRWVALEDSHRLPRPGTIYVNSEIGLTLDDYRLALMLLDTLDPKFGPGGGWPLWTEWGERQAIREWLDHAYAAPDRHMQTLRDLRKESRAQSQGPGSEELSREEWSTRYQAQLKTKSERLEAADVDAHNKAHGAMLSDDPWTHPGGPARFLKDPASVESRIPEIRELDRQDALYLALHGFSSLAARPRTRPGSRPEEAPEFLPTEAVSYRGVRLVGCRLDAERGLLVGTAAGFGDELGALEAADVKGLIDRFRAAVDRMLDRPDQLGEAGDF